MNEVNYDELVEIEKLLSADGLSIKEFLLELLMTCRWSPKYETAFMYKNQFCFYTDLILRVGFIKNKDEQTWGKQYTYEMCEITDKGRKYLEQQS